MLLLRVLCFVWCFSYFTLCHVLTEESVYWEIKNQTGILDGQSLRLRKLIHPTNTFHSCYEVSCEGINCNVENSNETSIEVCYPSLIVSGISKCGTSAMYELLSKFPNAVTMHKKENCPFRDNELLWDYFQSLPRMLSVGDQALIVDGCINVGKNIAVRALLHNPQAYYIMMVRDFADKRWSAYNFWCNQAYNDTNCISPNRWANPALHKRSPELFHSYLLSSKDNANGDHCGKSAGSYAKSYQHLQGDKHQHYSQKVIVIANEELNLRPLEVAQRIARFVNYSINGLDLSAFGKVRINAQENKGANSTTSKDNYLPGLYNISHYQPLLPASRTMIYKCWYEDCMALSKIPPYYKYTACHPQLIGNATVSTDGAKGVKVLVLSEKT